MSLHLDSTRMTKSLLKLKIKAMDKNDIFVFTAPNGAEYVAVILETVEHFSSRVHICYSQNKLFTYIEKLDKVIVAVGIDEFGDDIFEESLNTEYYYGDVITDYCTIPEYDRRLEDYYHQLDMANDYSDKTV